MLMLFKVPTVLILNLGLHPSAACGFVHRYACRRNHNWPALRMEAGAGAARHSAVSPLQRNVEWHMRVRRKNS